MSNLRPIGTIFYNECEENGYIDPNTNIETKPYKTYKFGYKVVAHKKDFSGRMAEILEPIFFEEDK